MSVNQEYLEFAREIACEAGKIMSSYFNKANISHYKSDNTIATKADEEINQLVIDKVRATYPEHGVYGEEDSFGRERSTLWICDPIDGPAMFARGIPTSVFSLALVVDGEPIVGVVLDPWTDRLYTAIKGQGAYCNGERIKVNGIGLSDKKAVSNIDIWPEAEIFSEMSRLLDDLNKKTYMVGIGSCINACMQVARGSFVAQVFSGTKGKNVDIAAAKVIVEEAGGKVTDIYGNDQRYDKDIKGAIITNGVTHDGVIDMIGQKKHLIRSL
jgi:fructose-1,6-bisphosphatase/inositol monophosphatase family enzyme